LFTKVLVDTKMVVTQIPKRVLRVVSHRYVQHTINPQACSGQLQLTQLAKIVWKKVLNSNHNHFFKSHNPVVVSWSAYLPHKQQCCWPRNCSSFYPTV